jgi:hypothetical protein
MNVEKIVEYPEQGIAILYDEKGRFVCNRDNLDILDIGPLANHQMRSLQKKGPVSERIQVSILE